MNVALVVPGGVDRGLRYRVIPCLLGLIGRVARRHHVHVFAMRQEQHPSVYPLLGATVHNIGWSGTRRRTLTAILRQHRRTPFGVIHALWATPSGLPAMVAARLTGCPLLVHLAGGELVWFPDIRYGGLGPLARRWAVRTVLARAAVVTAACTMVAEEAADLGIDTSRLVLGVDLDRWPVAPPRPRDRTAPLRLVHVASLNEIKDQGTLLEAVRMLRDRGVAFHLDMVGEDTLRGARQRQCESLGLGASVTFHGFLPQDALRPIVAGADLNLLSSRHEGGEVSTLEAAVVGVPTVGTAVGHVRDLAPHAAVAVPVGRADRLADAIALLAADEERRMDLGREAQAFAVRHDADRTAETVEVLYSAAAGTPVV